jgi:xanthine/CO dehydrogenase XdhC/CoxF family maturation factor
MGTVLRVDKKAYPVGASPLTSDSILFEQQLPPSLRLLIYGGEHDAVQLAAMGGIMGWDVRVTVAADEAKKRSNFPGATQFEAVIPEKIDPGNLDAQTAVILMTHSYTKDLKYLLQLVDSRPGYLGLLGPASRRERLLGDVMERNPDIEDAFFDQIHGPAGLDIGAETPQEIAVAVLSEILTVFRKASANSLREKEGGIH